MKITEFRKLIREEVRRVLKEAKVASNLKITSRAKPEELKKACGSFLTIKKVGGKDKYGDTIYTADLNVDAMLAAKKANSKMEIVKDVNFVSVYYNKYDHFDFDTKNVPADVLSAIPSKSKSSEGAEVTVQISDPEDNFMVPEDYGIPTIVQSIVGKPKFSAAAEQNQDVYEKEVNSFILKVEKALLAAGKKVVPTLQKGTIEDGSIIFKVSGKLNPADQSKLKALFKGAKSVEF